MSPSQPKALFAYIVPSAFLFAAASVLILCGEWLRIGDGLFLRVFEKSLLQRGFLVKASFLAAVFLSCVLVWCLSNRFLSERALHFFGVILLIVSVGCFVFLCSRQILRRDDYWEIADARELGLFGYISYEFQEICGRYFSLFLKGLYAVFPPLPYINTLLVLNLIALCSGSAVLWDAVSPENSGSKLESLMTGSCAAISLVLLSPNMWEV